MLALVIIITIILIGVLSLNIGSESERLSPAASYQIAGRWLGDNGRIFDLKDVKLTSPVALHLEADKPFYDGCYLIFKSKNLGVSAIIGGKTLYKSDSQLGSRYNLIPLGEVADGALYLHLEPNGRAAGEVISEIKITNRNDYILSLLSDNAILIILSVLLFILLCLFTAYIVYLISNGEREIFKYLYLSLFLSLLFVLLLYKSELLYFIFFSSKIIYALYYFSLMIILVPLNSFFAALLKINSRSLNIFQSGVLAYSVFRILLMLILGAPLERGIIISYALLFVQGLVLLCNIISVIIKKSGIARFYLYSITICLKASTSD